MLGMFKRLKALLTAPDTARPGPGSAEEERRLAAAALLVEAAHQDGDYASEERRQIRRLLAERFRLTEEETDALMAGAEEAQGRAVDLHGFTRYALAGMDEAGREALVEMLWRVVLADGALHDYEASLMRRVAGLLHVSDRASAAARRRVLDELSGARRESQPAERKGVDR